MNELCHGLWTHKCVCAFFFFFFFPIFQKNTQSDRLAEQDRTNRATTDWPNDEVCVDQSRKGAGGRTGFIFFYKIKFNLIKKLFGDASGFLKNGYFLWLLLLQQQQQQQHQRETMNEWLWYIKMNDHLIGWIWKSFSCIILYCMTYDDQTRDQTRPDQTRSDDDWWHFIYHLCPDKNIT